MRRPATAERPNMLDMAHLRVSFGLARSFGAATIRRACAPESLFASLPVVAFALAWACNGNNNNPNVVVGDDAPDDSPVATGDDSGDVGVDTGGGGTDATSDPCTLGDKATDPVALCIQQQVLGASSSTRTSRARASRPAGRRPARRTPLSPATRGRTTSGSPAALGAYYCSSEVYGNNHSTATFDSVLTDLGSVLVGELGVSVAPAGLVRWRDLLPPALGAGRVQLHRQRQRRGR